MLESVWETFGRVWPSSQSHMRPCHLGLLGMMTLSVVKEIQMSQKQLRLSLGPGRGGGGAQAAIPVVSVPDKNPSCPCCFTRFNWMLGLTEHLKRTHGQRKIFFKFSKCSKQNLKYHSIACHFPQCKGNACAVPRGDWICEVCRRGFSTKIGPGQHKKSVHPLVRNLERIVASHPKETSARGAHKQV